MRVTLHRGLPILLVCLALTTCYCVARTFLPPDPAIVAANPGVKRLSAADTDFGFRLLKQLNKSASDKNIFFSPFSISQALLLTMNGAGGKTRQDIARTLGVGTLPQEQINAANALLLPSLTNSDPKVEISSTNAIWADQGVTFSPAFQRRAHRFYSADATTLDFGSPAAPDTINGWASKNTQGKISKIVTHDDIARSEVVLTNAVYFHGLWQSAFDRNDTHDAPFTLAGGKTKTVPLMCQESSFAYLETPQFQAVGLPYGAGRMSLYVLLPKTGTSLDTVVSTLNSTEATQTIQAMKPTKMTIFLPRFKADYSVMLKAPLIALGMGLAVEAQADFRPMGLQKSYISAVIHKAVLEMDEEGTVAAAATEVGEKTASVQAAPPITMRVDHPFYCAIRDNLTGAILFEGMIRDPQ